MRVYERAYAKINLYLDVTGRDGDGYHTLRSVMQTVGLYDGITVDAVAAAAPSVSLSVRGRYRVPIGEGNLAHRAAMTYMEAAAVPMRVHIYMEKHIPVAAGLGGGSADAAAVLRAMNRIAGNRLTGARLLTLAATLGSDVPFCLLGHTRLCEGRGERMRALPPVPQIPLVILPSTERVSTPAAYAALDAAYGNFETVGEHADLDAMLSALGRGTSAVAPALYNIFEDAVLPTCPIAAANRRALLAHGAAAALMSGSGPTVFGLFTDEGDARRAAAALGNAAVATHTV